MNKKTMASAFIAASLSIALLAGCGQTNTTGTTAVSTGTTATSSTTTTTVSASTIAASTASVDVSFDSSDYYVNWQSASYKTLDMSTGSQTITASGVYEITGTLEDGSLVVDVDKSIDDGTVTLVLNNASITSATSAPIYIKDAEKVVLILENGTTNTVSQGSGVTVDADNEPSAAIFSKADLTITGSGTLNVTSAFNDGITSKDTLKITDGTLVIQAASDGIVGKDVLAVENGSITVTAGKDGLCASNDTDAGMGSILIQDGTFNITAENDAIQAYSVLQIDGGTFDLSSGGGYAGVINSNVNMGPGMMDNQTAAAESDTDSMKCLKASGSLVINGGTITASAYEDTVHSDGSLLISGGTLTLESGDDGLHAETDLAISSGSITISNACEGIESPSITVTGGDINLTANDDGFNANGSAGLLTISGGEIYVNAGGDGLDANGTINMTGGTVTVDGPTDSGNGAIDYTTDFTISGGTLVATGSSGMAQTAGTGSSQASILMYYTDTQAAGTTVTLKDASGTVVATFTPAKQYNSAAISAPGLITGQTYTLCSGDTEIVTFTLSDTVTYLSETGITTNQGMMQGGGMHGGGPGGQFHG